MKISLVRWSVAGALLTISVSPGYSEREQTASEKALEGLSWRSIGPADMSGRVVDIAGIPGDPSTVLAASASGGLWRTTNNGTTWESIFESGNTMSLGAVAVAPSDPNVIYLGTGEHNPRNSASIGDGVYKSTDAGKSWSHLGLKDTEKISRIRVHPANPDIVYVAALGHAWGSNEERGVFRSKDGGSTWEKILFVDEDTGASDLVMHPSNPRILFAGMYEYRRQPWSFRSGGEGSGLYKTTNGGETWEKLTDSGPDIGLPGGVLGRIGVAIARSNPDVVYAIIESKDGVLWRSDDGGENWKLTTDEPDVNSRPFYFSDIRVDPTNENRVYSMSGSLRLSEDGGKTWRRIAQNIHGDHQALWIDPLDPKRLIDGNDGGWAFSYDRGETWDFINTVPLGQFYQVGADMRDPYYVCGGLQDDDVWCGPSRTLTVAGILEGDWYEIHGPGDGMYVQIDPTDHTNIYTNSQAGNIVHFNLATGEARSVHPYPVPLSGSAAGDHPYRFNWNAPVHMSPHDPHTVYFGSNVLFKTTDGGQTWQAVSPDLTTNDPEKLQSSGGPITPDNTSAEYHCTILTVSESPVTPGLIWVGTDDGNLQITRDGGGSWTNVIENVPELPGNSWVSRIEASRADPSTAYASFDRHRENDPAPYVYKTTDYGRTWENITDDLPPLNYVHVIREDPRNPNLLYVGTELGIYASWSGGGDWSSIRLNLPPVAVRDILVHPRDNDLIIGTHGRSVWILDDAAPLQELGQALGEEAYLYPVRPATRFVPWKKRFKADIGYRVFIGENPPYGALLNYYLKESVEPPKSEATADEDGVKENKTEPKVTLKVLDGEGKEVRELEGPGKAGVQRIAWDLRYEPIAKPEKGEQYGFEMSGPLVLPGRYTVKLMVGEGELTSSIDVRLRSGTSASPRDLQVQLEALTRLKGMVERGIEAVRTIDDIKAQIEAMLKRVEKMDDAPETVVDEGRRLVSEFEAVRDKLARPSDDGSYRSHPRLVDKIRGLARGIDAATARPTAAQSDWLNRFSSDLDEVLVVLNGLTERDLEDFNGLVDEAGIPRIFISGTE